MKPETNSVAFVSYSHDDELHKEWVKKLVDKLIKYGITVKSDINFPLGGNLMLMMNQALNESDKVLVICTDNYIEKANSGRGGAGYENHIASAMIMASQDTSKFIPLIRHVSGPNKTPTSLLGRSYLDMSDDSLFEKNMITLVKNLTGNDITSLIKREKFDGYIPTSYFDARVKESFPDVKINDLTVFYGKNAVDRLDFLFKDYNEFTHNDFIWWFRGSDNAIHQYQRISDTKILIDGDCLYNISSIAVYSAQAYYQSFIYFEIEPENETGLYTNLNKEEMLKEWGYTYEEYAVFEGNFIKSNDFYNGATIINGLPCSLGNKANLMTHYTSKYNFLLAASNSPYSCEELRRILPELMNGILTNKYTLNEISNKILLKLPKR